MNEATLNHFTEATAQRVNFRQKSSLFRSAIAEVSERVNAVFRTTGDKASHKSFIGGEFAR